MARKKKYQSRIFKDFGDKITFRDARGRYSGPAKAVSFSLWVSGRKRPIKGEIPKESRRSVTSRRQYIFNEWVGQAKKWEEARLKRRKKKLADQVTKEKRRIRRQQRAEEKRRAEEERLLREAEEEGVEVYDDTIEEIEDKRERRERRVIERETPPDRLPKLRRQVIQEKPVVGKSYERRMEQEGRIGTMEYSGRQMELEKLILTFDKPIPIRLDSRKEQIDQLYEKLRPIAHKFVQSQQGVSEENFIFRIRTQHKISGQQINDQGIGTERIELSDPSAQHIDNWLYNGEDGLFDYFDQKYREYLSRAAFDTFTVQGFSIEVVKKAY